MKSIMHQAAAAALLGGVLCIAPQASAQNAPEATRELAPIDWEAARRDAEQQGLASPRPASARRGILGFQGRGTPELASLQIPLLLPKSMVARSDAGELSNLRVDAQPTHYSATARENNRSFLIQGTRVVFETEIPLPSALEPGPQGPVTIDKTEYGIELSFERYGAVYSISIFCDEALTDPFCATDVQIRSMAAEMVFSQ